MKINMHGKNVSITDAMYDKTEKKLGFLEKYFIIDENTTANVVVKVYPNAHQVEITIYTKMGILRAEVSADDFYAALDLAVDKLEDQIRRQKTRLSRRYKSSLAESFVIEDQQQAEEEIPVRTKRVEVRQMDLDEAILQMEMLGHSFFAYIDEETNEVAVVYRRNRGGYGLLELEKSV